MPAWTETTSSRAGALEIIVDAIDVVRTEKSEMASFRDALSAPAVEKGVERTDPRGVVKGFVRLGALVLGFLIYSSLRGLGAGTMGAMGVTILLFLATAGLIAFWSRSSRRSTSVPEVRDRFTVAVDDSGLVVAGTDTRCSYRLEAIERFDGANRLVVVFKDGSRADLPLALASLPENQALAARLNDALVEARAAGGYRGRGPRMAVAPEPFAAEEEPASADQGDKEAAARSSGR